MIKLVCDDQYNPLICKWLMEQVPGSSFDPNNTTTFANVEFYEDNSFDIVFAAVYHDRSKHGVMLTVASNGEKRQKLTPQFLHALFSYPFERDNKQAIYAVIDVSNVLSINLTEKMGFKKVGYLPHYCGENQDAYVYCFTRTELQALRAADYRVKVINKPSPPEKLH